MSEKELKAKVDEYFEKYMCVSFDKFLENFKEAEEWYRYKDKEIKRLNKEKSILEKAFRLVIQYDIGVINYDELDKANRMIEKYNKELKEGK